MTYEMAKAEAMRALMDAFGPDKAGDILAELGGGLRDQFAQTALSALILLPARRALTSTEDVDDAYKIADRMMERRKTK